MPPHSMRPRVFISREQRADSPFTQLVAPHAEVIGRSLVGFEAVQPAVVPTGDWLFFYSKNGIRYGLPHWQALGELPPIGLMGQGSADYLQAQYGVKAAFVGKGRPSEIAQAFGLVAQGQTVVFVQASQSRQSVQQHLEGNMETQSVVVYQNQPAPADDLPFCDFLVFTSPMNVDAYFYNHSLHPQQHIISIGTTTAAALHAQGIQQIHLAEAPHEPALAKACLVALQNG